MKAAAAYQKRKTRQHEYTVGHKGGVLRSKPFNSFLFILKNFVIV